VGGPSPDAVLRAAVAYGVKASSGYGVKVGGSFVIFEPNSPEIADM
jgi:hypothetical protein